MNKHLVFLSGSKTGKLTTATVAGCACLWPKEQIMQHNQLHKACNGKPRVKTFPACQRA